MSERTAVLAEALSAEVAKDNVDFDNAVIHNVKILGFKSKNRRTYLAEGVSPESYEGRYVRIDHPAHLKNLPPTGLPVDRASQAQGRVNTSRFARLTGVTKTADGLFAESLQCNPKHPFTQEFLWWVANCPDAFSLSHAAECRYKQEKDGSVTVLQVVKVHSVDVVEHGGTTATMFESLSEMEPKVVLGEFVLGLFAEGTDVADIQSKIEAGLNAIKPIEFTGDVAEAVAALADSTDPRVRVLVESYTADQANRALSDKRARATKACIDAKIPSEAISTLFVESLVERDEASWPAHIEDRRRSAAAGKRPVSVGGDVTKPTVKDFVAQFRTRG